jgi:hypothetical protein
MKPTLDGKLDVHVPILLETRLLVQANSGGGKSFALRRLLEQTAPMVQQFVIDSEGEFATLREKFDYVICAPHDGDALATPKTAALLARRLLEAGVSAILNIYDLKSYERQTFVRLFLEALINAPRELWRPVLVVLDEAHVFCPQSGSAEASQSVIDLATRGRKRGFALCCATQRLSKLHKDVAAELLNKMIGRTGLDVDVKRAADELGMSSRDAVKQLRELKPGSFYVFGPALSDTVRSIKIGSVVTTHPRPGARLMTAPPAASKAILKSLAKLSDLQKDAEHEARTIDELKSDNAKLRREITLANKRAEQAGVPEAEVQRRIAEATRLVVLDPPIQDVVAHTLLAQIRQLLNGGSGLSPKVRKAIADRGAEMIGRRSRTKLHPATEPLARSVAALPQGERAVLIAVAQHVDGVTREQITVLTGYKRSTRDAYISRLRERRLVDAVAEHIVVTEAGKTTLGLDFKPLPTGTALRDHWLQKLPKGEADVLRVLVAQYPETLDRERVTDATGFKRSTRDAYIARLNTRRLVVATREGVKASKILFD